VNTPLLEEELAQIHAQIDQTRQRHEALDGELRGVESELESFSVDRQRFDALRDVCNALDRLEQLKADDLFWDNIQNHPRYLEQARNRVDRFDKEISGLLGKQTSLQEQINQILIEMELHFDQIQAAHAREERRQDEYLVEREISFVPSLTMEGESERRYRKSMLIALAFCFLFSTLMVVWKVPPPVRPMVAEVPQRLVSMLRKEPPKPPPRQEEKNPEQEKEAKKEQPKPTEAEKQAARKKAESSGVLAFKNTFKDLMDETPESGLGASAHLNSQPAAGRSRASRSLIAMQSGGSSGGISNAGVSRNIGSVSGNSMGGVGFTRVQSSVAGLAEKSRPINSGPGAGRTDEEIQIVFDRYKATLYRMYNTELRRNPTLRGKIVLRITIEPGGEVSACSVQSSELASPGLVAQIVARVKRFNFGPKEKVSRTTILYPIDFLPAG
jgi:outer membrane biosynthesis protein TonB